jgi:hypothetical protein
MSQPLPRLPKVKLHGGSSSLAVLVADRGDDRFVLVEHPLRPVPIAGAGQVERQLHEAGHRIEAGLERRKNSLPLASAMLR